jgi:hypothetical protein
MHEEEADDENNLEDATLRGAKENAPRPPAKWKGAFSIGQF